MNKAARDKITVLPEGEHAKSCTYHMPCSFKFKKSITIYRTATKWRRFIAMLAMSAASDRAEVRAHGRSRCMDAWCLLSMLLLTKAAMGRLGRSGPETPISRPQFDGNTQAVGASLLIVIWRRVNTSSPSFCALVLWQVSPQSQLVSSYL